MLSRPFSYLFLIFIPLCSCTWERDLFINDHESDININSPDREWLFLFYVNGDNIREGYALDLVNQLEELDLDGKSMDILVLLDRSAIHASDDGDWDETRLFHIDAGIDGDMDHIHSTSLNVDFGAIQAPGELNMGNPSVLSSFVGYAVDSYAARRTGLILWGEGNGWRTSYDDSNGEDNIAGDSLSIQELGIAFEDIYFDFIFFDSENSAILELLYEIQSASDLVVAKESSEVTELSYYDIYENFSNSDKTPEAFCDLIAQDYKEINETINIRSSISVIDTSMILPLNNALNEFSLKLEQYIDDAAKQEEIIVLYTTLVNKYVSKDDDVFMDINTMSVKTMEQYSLVEDEAQALCNAIDDLVITHWSSNQLEEENGGIGLNLGHKNGLGEIVGPVVSEFIEDGDNTNKLAFVRDSSWNLDRVNEQGFLYVLWEEEF